MNPQRPVPLATGSRQPSGADMKLLGRMANGDPGAIGIFVDRWASSLYKLTDGLRMDTRSGDTVAEEVFRRVMFEAPRFVARPEKFFPWILETARDCAAAVLMRKPAMKRDVRRRIARETAPPQPRSDVAESCSALLREERIADVLGYLNSLTSYRFTAIYRFDGVSIENVHLFDRQSGFGTDGSVSPTSHTYCLWIQETLSVVQMSDSFSDPRAVGHPKKEIVRSYCGGPICDPSGHLLGTICHFDYEARTSSPDASAVLAAVSPLLVSTLSRRPAS